MKPPINPPWFRDGNPELWVPLAVAASQYFRKSRTQIKRYIKEGVLEEFGMASYFDGHKWYVRLPAPIQPDRSDRSNRRVA